MSIPQHTDSLSTEIKEKLSYKPFAIFWLVLSLLWACGTVVMSVRYVVHQANLAYQDAQDAASQALNDAHLGLSGNIRDLHATPATVARISVVRRVLGYFADHPIDPVLSTRGAQEAISNSEAGEADAELEMLVRDKSSMSVIWLIAANGRAVASSNAADPDSFVGTDYSDREYFLEAMQGKAGSQFAVGRVSNIPGLFYSAPVQINGRTVGVVAGKISLDFLAHWAKQTNAFVTDENGVVISAKDPGLVMKVMPGARAQALSREYLLNRYKQAKFEEMRIEKYQVTRNPQVQHLLSILGFIELPDVVSVSGLSKPVLLSSKEVDGQGLQVFSAQPVEGINSIPQDILALIIAGCLFGGFLIATLTNLVYWALDRQLAKRNQAKRALIAQMSELDPLTGVLNSGGIEKRVRSVVKASQESGVDSALIFLDLDFFKDINDSLGHEAGNEALREVARRISTRLDAKSQVIRYGSDEFVVLLPGIGSKGYASTVAASILDAIREPMELCYETQFLTASIGIAMIPEAGTNAAALLSNANTALNKVKERGKADTCFYHPSFQEAKDEERELAKEIRIGIERGEFEVYYQAQFSNLTHGVIGFEALLRWKHPDKGMVSPGIFIPVAEKTGLIIKLGEATIKAACKQAGQWKREFDRDVTIAVNMSAIHLRRKELVTVVKKALKANGLHGNALELEITESLVVDDAESVFKNIEALRALGVKFSIDDFGTGYSGLSRLRSFPVDALKIDQSFVREMVSQRSDLDVVKAIIELGKALGLHVIAEGVETVDQFDLLTDLGCHSVQGYLFHRPSNVSEATEFLRRAVECQPSACRCKLSLAA